MAVSIIKAEKEQVIVEIAKATNCTIDANSQATITYTIPAKKGYNTKLIRAWCDGTGTTDPINFTQCFGNNAWGDSGSADSAKTGSVQVRNFAASQAKVTVNCSILYYR